MWIMFKKQFYKCLLQNAEYVMGFFQMIESFEFMRLNFDTF